MMTTAHEDHFHKLFDLPRSLHVASHFTTSLLRICCSVALQPLRPTFLERGSAQSSHRTVFSQIFSSGYSTEALAGATVQKCLQHKSSASSCFQRAVCRSCWCCPLAHGQVERISLKHIRNKWVIWSSFKSEVRSGDLNPPNQVPCQCAMVFSAQCDLRQRSSHIK